MSSPFIRASGMHQLSTRYLVYLHLGWTTTKSGVYFRLVYFLGLHSARIEYGAHRGFCLNEYPIRVLHTLSRLRTFGGLSPHTLKCRVVVLKRRNNLNFPRCLNSCKLHSDFLSTFFMVIRESLFL